MWGECTFLSHAVASGALFTVTERRNLRYTRKRASCVSGPPRPPQALPSVSPRDTHVPLRAQGRGCDPSSSHSVRDLAFQQHTPPHAPGQGAQVWLRLLHRWSITGRSRVSPVAVSTWLSLSWAAAGLAVPPGTEVHTRWVLDKDKDCPRYWKCLGPALRAAGLATSYGQHPPCTAAPEPLHLAPWRPDSLRSRVLAGPGPTAGSDQSR